MRSLVIFFVSFLVVCKPVFTQDRDYRFKRLNTDNGLSKNNVYAVTQDKQGFMWFGTDFGLNRYDGYDFKKYFYDEDDTASLANNYVSGLLIDNSGNLWVGTNGYIHRYNAEADNFERIRLFNKHKEYQGILSMTIINDDDDNIWAGDIDNGLYKYDVNQKKVIDYSGKINDLGVGTIRKTSDGNIWVGTDMGKLFCIDKTNDEVKEYNNPNIDQEQLHDDFVWFIEEMQGKPQLLIGTARGLFDFDRNTGTFSVHNIKNTDVTGLSFTCYYRDTLGTEWFGTSGQGLLVSNNRTLLLERKPNNMMSLSNNEVNDIYRDRSGVYWVVTMGGINKLDPALFFFKYYQNDPNDPRSLQFNNISSFCEDKDKHIWIGTQGGGINVFFPETEDFYPLEKVTGKTPPVLGKVVYDLCASSDGNIWIATRDALDRYDQNTGRFYHYDYHKYNPDFLSKDNYSLDGKAILSLAEGVDGEIWMGTYGGGVTRINVDKRTGTAVFRNFKHIAGDKRSISNNYIRKVFVDRFGIVWIGTLGSGLDRFDPALGEFNHYSHLTDDTGSLSNDFVTEIYEDHFGNLWVGTYLGLNKFDREHEKFTIFYVGEKEPYRMISEIFLDKRNNLWITTDNGLYRYNLKSQRVNRYSISHGLQGNNFNINALFSASDGSVFIGGRNGFNLFRPDDFRLNTFAPPVAITEVTIDNKPVRFGYGKDGIIIYLEDEKSNTIDLTYDNKVISFKFAALSYTLNDQYRYAYKMEGLNKKWVYTGSDMRVATFTNLYPRKYSFRVKAANNDGIWSESGPLVRVHMAVPYWKSWWAILFYVLVILSIFYLVLRFVLVKKRLEDELYSERLEREKIMEINKMKIEFFSNISHEFRTPLTLILSPVESMIKKTDNAEVLKKLKLMHTNATRLLNLVNQLLNLRKSETDNWRMNTEPIDMIEFVEEIKTSFNELAAKKQIIFQLQVQLPRPLILWVDRLKMKSVFYNLLSNAFKHTPDGRKITIVIRREFLEHDKKHLFRRKLKNEGGDFIVIDIIDEGTGIPKDKINYIFDRFYTIETNTIATSTGIGLTLVRSIMLMHQGKVTVESVPGKGSKFSVYIPDGEINKNEEYPVSKGNENEKAGIQEDLSEVENDHIVADSESEKITEDIMHDENNNPIVLVIEDDEDIRHYIIDELNEDYVFREASNGLEGLTIAKEELPDLIISDIIMPEMDGNEMVSRLKEDIATSHIPIILLTAKSAEEDIVEGLKTGADSYVTKPFNIDVLKAGIDNLLKSREKLREKYSNELMLKPRNVVIKNRDGELLTKLVSIIEENMDDPDFSVKTLVDGVGLSRMQLYRKLKAVIDKTPHDLINDIRLERAAQLLKQNQVTISEVAYMVGFNTPKYFSRCFREKYGMLPTQYIRSEQNDAGDDSR